MCVCVYLKVLRITPETGACVAMGGPWPGHWKWHGGVMAADGNIYGALQCVILCCSVLRCVAVCSSVFQRVAV